MQHHWCPAEGVLLTRRYVAPTVAPAAAQSGRARTSGGSARRRSSRSRGSGGHSAARSADTSGNALISLAAARRKDE